MPMISEPERKICTRAELIDKVRSFKKKGKTIVFTNGCFDLIHIGHTRYLADAGREGDILVVGVNTDNSVRIIKPHNRPIVPEDQRAEVIASLESVDLVTLFDEPDPENLIRAVEPDVLAKGADWKIEDIIGADLVMARGGRVCRIKLEPGVSTTRIIENINLLNTDSGGIPNEIPPEK